MKFSLATIAAFASAVTAATLPKSFTLVADGGSTLVTDGRMYIAIYTIINLSNLFRIPLRRRRRHQHHRDRYL